MASDLPATVKIWFATACITGPLPCLLVLPSSLFFFPFFFAFLFDLFASFAVKMSSPNRASEMTGEQ